MAIIHDTLIIPYDQAVPSLGSLIGSRVSSEVFDSINAHGHSSFFGGEFEGMRQEFFDRYLKPMDLVNQEISRTVNALMNPDQYRILASIEDFRSIPPCMELMICMMDPIRKGMLEGRLDGFGYDPHSLPEEDHFGRLLSNFHVEDVAAMSDSEGVFELTAQQRSDDESFTPDQLYAMRRTREYILEKILGETDRDPTSIDTSRG